MSVTLTYEKLFCFAVYWNNLYILGPIIITFNLLRLQNQAQAQPIYRTIDLKVTNFLACQSRHHRLKLWQADLIDGHTG